MRNSKLAACLLENLTVEIVSSVYLVSLTHTIELDDMRQLMQENQLEKREAGKNKGRKFNLFFPWVCLAKPPAAQLHELHAIMREALLLQSDADVKVNFLLGQHAKNLQDGAGRGKCFFSFFLMCVSD